MNECGKKVLGIVVFSLIFLSCGIEEYIYLAPVPGEFNSQSGDNVTIPSLPNSSSQSSYFTNYSIYYRIYLSNEYFPAEIPKEENTYTSINPSLYSDFRYIEPYTITDDDTTMSPSNVYSTFRNRNYNTIAVEGINIETLLNNTADGKELILDFRENSENPPVLILDGVSYTLRRSLNEGGPFTPKPDYTFRNSEEIRNDDYDNDKSEFAFNKDVQANIQGNTVIETSYCYVSLYIVKEGVETAGFTRIFSFPTFLGVFRLPS